MLKRHRFLASFLLCIILISNMATPVAYASEQVKLPVNKPASDFYDATTLAPSVTDLQPDRGSVLGASTSLLTAQSAPLDLDGGNGASANIRIAPRMQILPQRVYNSDEDVVLSVINPDDEPVTTTVLDKKGIAIPVPVTDSYDGTTTTVDLASADTIHPGRFTLRMTDSRGQVTTQDFSWGVLAMNFDRSEYQPGEKGDISFAVLNDNGDMVCTAQLSLKITNESTGHTDMLASGLPGSVGITVNPQCQNHAFSLESDYEAHYSFAGAGEYSMTLTAIGTGGIHTITDSIQVSNTIPFDVQRVSATRVYPPNTYPMLFNITAQRDFTGTVTETVPDSFTITPATQSAVEETGQGGSVSSYSNMQTVYLNNNDPSSNLHEAIIASDAAGLVMPFIGDYPITQGFGAQQTDPSLQAFYTQFGLAGHDGIDFGVPMETPLYAVDGGTVIWSGPGDYGITIIIQHGWGESYYGHLSSTVAKVGQEVAKGELIGYSGESGDATGPHLHFGMRPDNPDMTNGYYGKIDPLPYLPFGHEPEAISSLEPNGSLASALQAGVSQDDGTAVLGASDSGDTQGGSPTPSSIISPTFEPSVISPSEVPTVTQTASGSAAISLTPTPGTETPTPTPFAFVNQEQSEIATGGANESFSVLDKQIKLNEALAASMQTEKVKVITWQVRLKKGQSTTLGYDYQVPSVSPEFYMLGPLKFYASKNNTVVYQEQRQWEIASDDVGVAWYYNATANTTWNGYSWQYRKKIAINSSLVSATATNSGTVTFMDSGGDATNTNGGTNLTTATGGFLQSTFGGTITTDCTNSETGPCSIKLSEGASVATMDIQTPSGAVGATTGRISFYYYMDTVPTGDAAELYQANGSTFVTEIFGVDSTTHKICGTSCGAGEGSMLLSTGTWYRISIAYSITSTTVNQFNIYVNGNLQVKDTNQTISAITPGVLRLGDLSPSSANEIIHIDDIYADTGSDLSDPGDVHVTVKRAFANGATNSFTTTLGTGSGYGTNRAQEVNWRPINGTTNGFQSATDSQTEEYTVEGQGVGDVNIPTNAGVIADQAWLDMNSSATCTAGTASIVNNGVVSNLTLPTTQTMETNYQTINSTGPYPNKTYPSGNTAVGLESCSAGTARTISLYGAGVQIAYIPDLSYFPLLVNLSADPDLSAHAQTLGNDILFTDSTGQNLLNFQIETYNAGSLYAWVQVPSVSTQSNSSIYMYYGNPAQSSSLANSTAVWPTNQYISVWHYGTGSPVTFNLNDSTSNANNVSTNHSVAGLAGQINEGANFNSADYADMGSGATMKVTKNYMTFETWFKVTVTQANNTFASEGPIGTNGVEIGIDNGTCTKPNFKVTKYGFTDICAGTPPVGTGTWHMFDVVYSVSGVQVYVDGTLSNPVSSDTHNIVSATSNFLLGAGAGGVNILPGAMDESRLYVNSLSAGWIATEFNNTETGSTLTTLGKVETSAYAPTLLQVLRHGQFFGNTGATSGVLQPFTW